ncbi:hypothetical protein H4219_005302 [Mycoemilia scoparia]|uniref:Uncharacterized protein n=1 Tax=Mycoemilia scoparia TaxID=417184 RepID=A0A9W7ZPP3_9FUNG|nr:hypothetical protein H4219_005302 [Mycoemilia scoparia]
MNSTRSLSPTPQYPNNRVSGSGLKSKLFATPKRAIDMASQVILYDKVKAVLEQQEQRLGIILNPVDSLENSWKLAEFIYQAPIDFKKSSQVLAQAIKQVGVVDGILKLFTLDEKDQALVLIGYLREASDLIDELYRDELMNLAREIQAQHPNRQAIRGEIQADEEIENPVKRLNQLSLAVDDIMTQVKDFAEILGIEPEKIVERSLIYNDKKRDFLDKVQAQAQTTNNQMRS